MQKYRDKSLFVYSANVKTEPLATKLANFKISTELKFTLMDVKRN